MTTRGLPAHAAGLDAYPRILPLADTAASVEFADVIDPAINARVAALDIAVSASELPGIVETTPTYRSLLICYDPAVLNFASLVGAVRKLIRETLAVPEMSARRWTVPVLYGPPHGEDLAEVARHCGLHRDEVIAAHTGVEFRVYLVGFAPGVPVLGRLPVSLHMPRRTRPRPSVAAGSVLIAGAQASLLSNAMPSGWHILGRTPVRAFQPEADDPFLFRPGDRVRFRAIDRVAFDDLAEAAARGRPAALLDTA